MASGKTWKLTDYEMETVAPKMQQGGIRLYRVSNGFVPLNSNTIEFIERVEDEPVKEKPMEHGEEAILKPMVQENKPEEKKESDEEKAKRKMDEIIAKSNCTHPEEKMEIYQKATAKGIRFFPVCSFCGKRERYVKADSLTDEQKLNAKVWND
jgi:hypothetical protein